MPSVNRVVLDHSIATACMCEYDIVVSCMSLPPFRDTNEEKPVEAKTN